MLVKPLTRLPWLLACPQCGDTGCGAVTCELAIDGDVVRWSRFAEEVDWVVEGEPDETRLDFEPFVDIGPFVLNAIDYRDVIRRAAAMLE